MASPEKCDILWGADENPLLLRNNFELRILERGLTAKRSVEASTSSESTSTISWKRKPSSLQPAKSVDSLDSVCDVTNVSESTEAVEVENIDKPRKLVSRAGAHIKRMARNTGEIGLKLVALPTIVVLDIVS